MLELYLDPCTVNSRKVLAGLDLVGKEYNLTKVNFFTGEHRNEDYVKKINPFATVPTAVDGDLHITESNAILMYAADTVGSESPAYPKDPKIRADINRWLLFEASLWFGSNYIYLVQNVVQPLLGNQASQEALDAEAPNWHKYASILDQTLGKHKFIVGNEVTIADIAIASCMHLYKDMKVPMEKYANLQRWMADIEALPSWQKTQDAVESALLPNKKKANGSGDSQVRATFNYTKDLGDKLTELYFYEDVRSESVHGPGDDAHEMAVHDGWPRAAEFDIDREGFAIRDFSSAFPAGKWEDEGLVREKFYPEVVDFLKREIGAKRVLVFDHTIRTRANTAKKLTQETNTSQRAPVALVHCDYTAESGPLRVKQLLPEEADDLLSRRVAFVNVWKPLAKVEEQPLAMCDVTTSPPDDFFKLYLHYRDRTGENYVMRHNDSHMWYYFPGMTNDKAILLKTYESDEKRARFVGHSAFTDPTSKPDAPYRESVEIRTIAFF